MSKPISRLSTSRSTSNRPPSRRRPAQQKAWREAGERLHNEAAKIAAAKRPDIDAAVKQMKADASGAEARLQKLKQAGSKSWAALSAALEESRKAFDRANQAAWEALKRATAH